MVVSLLKSCIVCLHPPACVLLQYYAMIESSQSDGGEKMQRVGEGSLPFSEEAQ